MANRRSPSRSRSRNNNSTRYSVHSTQFLFAVFGDGGIKRRFEYDFALAGRYFCFRVGGVLLMSPSQHIKTLLSAHAALAAADASGEFHPAAVDAPGEKVDVAALQRRLIEEAIQKRIFVAIQKAEAAHPSAQFAVVKIELDGFALAQERIHSRDIFAVKRPAPRGLGRQRHREKPQHQGESDNAFRF